MNRKLFPTLVTITLILLISLTFVPQNVFAAVPGLPFTEDFTDTALLDAGNTNANWSTEEEALILNWREAQYGVFDPGLAGSDISSDTNKTTAIALGDVDGDGDLDLVAGNYTDANRLYLNNGSADPFNGVAGSDISSDAHATYSIALGDVDGDGNLDMLAGNNGINRLYLNNGSADPFNGVTGSNISSDAHATYSIALGDVDGDGDLDMLAGNDNAQTNRLYLNNGSADPFSGVSGSNISGDVDSTRSIALADVDGDGDLDLVAGTSGLINRLYLNNGSADPFSGVTGSDISSDTHWTYSIALADVDGDGDLDMLAGNSNQVNRLYLNNGTADPFNSVTGTDISSDVHDTESIAVGDVDGDGDLDMLVGNYSLTDTNRLYLNNGSADPFSGVTGSDISGDAHNTLSVALADVDGDGDLDLLAGNFSQTNRLYLNEGTASPFNGVAGSDISSDADYTRSIALADVDGDGDLDLVAGNSNETNRLYLNDGTSTPFSGVAGSDISGDANATISVALGDVDGDGDLDLVAGNLGERNRLYLNDGTATPFSTVVGSDISIDEHQTLSVALGDVDGDGDLDLVAGNNNQINYLYMNDGSAKPFGGVVGAAISNDTDYTYSIVLADVNRDGDLDLVAGNLGKRNRLYLNNGTAAPFSGVTGTDISNDTHDTWAIAVGDVDGDGDLDLAAGNYNEANRLYLNNGTAAPFSGVAGTDISGDAHNTTSIVLGDIDGDGDLDMLAGNYLETNRMYLNNGTSDPFNGVTGTDISSETADTRSIALGDADGDGDLDLLTGNYNQVNRLYLSRRGSSPFNGVTASDISSDAHATWDIALGDVDGDGDLDLAVGNRSSQTNRLYLNNGTATPFSGVSGSDISSDTDNTQSIALADVDGDGDLDMVTGNRYQVNHLYLNDGTATPFSSAAGLAIGSDTDNTTSIALADMDGDGDLDVVTGNWNLANRLYLNNGTVTPFSGVTGLDISSDHNDTYAIALGDVDGDGDLDMLAGNYNQYNRLYMNDGSADPFSTVTGSNISNDMHNTWSIALADVDGDGNLDLAAGNESEVNRLYLNNGSADPFSGVTGSDISSDAYLTRSVVLADVDADGDLDLVTGNQGANCLYLNNGTASPFSAVTGSNITNDGHNTYSIGLGDMDGDGDLDLVTGNLDQPNYLYLRRNNYHTAHGLGTSLRVDTESSNIGRAKLTASADLPINTRVTYYLSNNGGARWYIVQSGVGFTFPTAGMDLRWKVELESFSPILTPKLNQIQIEREDYSIYLPLIYN